MVSRRNVDVALQLRMASTDEWHTLPHKAFESNIDAFNTSRHFARSLESTLDAAPILSRGKCHQCSLRHVDVHASATGQFSILRQPRTLQAWARIHKSRDQAEAKAALDQLLREVLPKVRVGSAKIPPRLEDAFVFSLNLQRGGPFPTIHWDKPWGLFPDVPGFQLWYLVEDDENSRRGVGNMFLVEASDSVVDPHPIHYTFTSDGGARVQFDEYGFPLRTYPRIDDAGLQFRYLGMEPGDCLVFSKRTLHMSDPRPMWRGDRVERLAGLETLPHIGRRS